jgi:hypothetical protein
MFLCLEFGYRETRPGKDDVPHHRCRRRHYHHHHEISSSHGAEYEVWSLLGCSAVVTLKLATASIIRTIALMMEAVHTSETSVNFNVTTRRYIPEDSKLHHHHRSVHDQTLCAYQPSL